MATFFDTYINITPPLTTGWQTVDLTTHGVPADAVAIIRGYNTYPGYRGIGARKYGSSDARTRTINLSQVSIICGCDINSKIDLYRINSSINFYLCGYLTSSEATYYTNGIVKNSESTGWATISCSEVPDNTTYAIFEVNRTYSNGVNFRKTGSTDVRQPITIAAHYWFAVGLNESKQCDIWQETIENSTVYLVGYINSGISKINATDISLVTTGSYINIDLSGDAPLSDCAAIIEVYTTISTEYFDLRKDGISQELYQPSYFSSGTYIIPLSVSKIIEGKISSSSIDFFNLGYISPPITNYEYIGNTQLLLSVNSDYILIQPKVILNLNLNSDYYYVDNFKYTGEINLPINLNSIYSCTFTAQSNIICRFNLNSDCYYLVDTDRIDILIPLNCTIDNLDAVLIDITLTGTILNLRCCDDVQLSANILHDPWESYLKIIQEPSILISEWS